MELRNQDSMLNLVKTLKNINKKQSRKMKKMNHHRLLLLILVEGKYQFGFGSSLGWLERYPDQAAMLRAAGGGSWFHQFRAVTLIRISPFPYPIYNYCAVATRVNYGPYIVGSLLGMVPEIFVAIYTGIIVRTLADASTAEQKGFSILQIVLNILGFVAAVVTTVLITKYAKRQLEVMKKEEEALLLQ